MSAYIKLSSVAKQDLELAGASVNELELDDARVLAWVERWRGAKLGEDAQGDWAPIDATASFADGMQAGKSVRMNITLLLDYVMPDFEGHPYWIAFAQALSSKFAPVIIGIEPQSSCLSFTYEQLLYEGTDPQVALYCEKLAYLASVAIPAIARIRLEAWTLDDVRNLAQLVLNEALTLGYQQ
jgi:hypothetical protein